MLSNNSHDGNGGGDSEQNISAPAHGGNVIPLPDTVARADLPVVAPEAISGFDPGKARIHIALLLGVPADAAEFFSIHFACYDDDLARKSPKLIGDAVITLPDLQNNLPFLMRRRDGGTFWKEGLLDLQSKGAGLFITVNETKGDRRRREDVIRYLANFLEYDNQEGKSLEEILKDFPIAPSLITESSPNKYHFYWLVGEDWPATPANENLWYGIQRRLVYEYDGDDNAYDSARVLRLGGSLHLKGEPWRVRIIDASGRPYATDELEAAFANVPRYAVAELAKAFPPVEMAKGPESDVEPDVPGDPIGRHVDWERAKVALRYIHPDCHNLRLEGRNKPLKPYKPWLDIGMAIRSRFGDDGFKLWDGWSATSSKYPGLEGSDGTWAKWDSFDKPGDDRHGRPQVTLRTIFFFAKQHGWPNGPVPQWNLATGPQIAPVAGSRDGKPITVPDMPSRASGPATANAEALPAAAVAEMAPGCEASTQAASWLDTPNPFAASASAAAPDSELPPVPKPKPFIYRDPRSIPPRRWVYGGHYIRGFVTATLAPGGMGKSSLALVEALAIATGRPLLGTMPDESCKVWYYNLEDPYEELQRRVAAAMIAHNVKPEEIEGRLFINSGRDESLVIARQLRSGLLIPEPRLKTLTQFIRDNGIGVMTVDPFVASHEVPENDNPAVNAVMRAWGKVADKADCSSEMVHHTRKLNGAEEPTVEDGRGASAQVDATRACRILVRMTKDDAKGAGIDEEDRRKYFKLGKGDKASMAPYREKAEWYQFDGVDLGNARDGRKSDNVGVVKSWSYPSLADSAPLETLHRLQSLMAFNEKEGAPYGGSPRADDWVGKALAEVLNLDINAPGVRDQVRETIKKWTSEGYIRIKKGKDAYRHDKLLAHVGKPVSSK